MADALTVLIPTHGRAALLARTLASLAEAALPDAYRETVVVENGPPAGAADLVAAAAAEHPALRLRYLHVERANKSHALNEALRTVAAGLVVFFDDDIRLAPQTLAAYAEAAAGRSSGAYFGGPFGVDYEEPPPDWLVPRLPWSARGFELNGPRPEYYLGFNWAAFTDDLATLGGFDPSYGPGSPTGARGQETNMQERLRQHDINPVDVPDARVWHYVPRERSTPEWTLHRLYRSGLSRGIQARRERGRRFALQAAKRVVRTLPLMVPVLLRRGSPEWYEAVLQASWSFGIVRGYITHPTD